MIFWSKTILITDISEQISYLLAIVSIYSGKNISLRVTIYSASRPIFEKLTKKKL